MIARNDFTSDHKRTRQSRCFMDHVYRLLASPSRNNNPPNHRICSVAGTLRASVSPLLCAHLAGRRVGRNEHRLIALDVLYGLLLEGVEGKRVLLRCFRGWSVGRVRFPVGGVHRILEAGSGWTTRNGGVRGREGVLPHQHLAKDMTSLPGRQQRLTISPLSCSL